MYTALNWLQLFFFLLSNLRSIHAQFNERKKKKQRDELHRLCDAVRLLSDCANDRIIQLKIRISIIANSIWRSFRKRFCFCQWRAFRIVDYYFWFQHSERSSYHVSLFFVQYFSFRSFVSLKKIFGWLENWWSTVKITWSHLPPFSVGPRCQL